MITKAIVESKVDNYHYKVRIPLFDRVNDSPIYTELQDLCTANICIAKGLNNNIQVGDIVFVSFEDNNASKPIILGLLYREDLVKDMSSTFTGQLLSIVDSVTLPTKTSIGKIQYEDLINLLNEVSELKLLVNQLSTTILELSKKI